MTRRLAAGCVDGAFKVLRYHFDSTGRLLIDISPAVAALRRRRLISTNNSLNLSRLFIEGTVIVVSILLAFAIDAWWEERQEQELLDKHVGVLVAELSQTRSDIAIKGSEPFSYRSFECSKGVRAFFLSQLRVSWRSIGPRTRKKGL